MGKQLPDVYVGPPTATWDGYVRDVAGPKKFVEVVVRELHPITYTGGWDGVHLITSNGVNLGTLWEVRQEYHYWMEQQEAFAVPRGLPVARKRKAGTTGRNTSYVPKRRRH